MNNSEKHSLRQTWLLLMWAIFFLGINWPIMKIGLADISPLWFATLRIALAAIAVFIYLAIKGHIQLPAREEYPLLISGGIFQFGVFMALIHSAIALVDAGRSAVLVYTTPIWAAPLAFYYLSEKLNRMQMLSVSFAVIGLITLFNPFTFNWQDGTNLLGNGLLIGAAIVSAGVIVHVRHAQIRPHFRLLGWQLLIALFVLVPLSLVIEGIPQISLTNSFIFAISFNAFFVTAFSFWAYLNAAKVLPANTTAMASLGVPVIGVIASAIIIGEQPSIELILGLCSIIIGQIIFHRSKKK